MNQLYFFELWINNNLQLVSMFLFKPVTFVLNSLQLNLLLSHEILS